MTGWPDEEVVAIAALATALAAPDFDEAARSAAREAVLLTTSVEVPRGGLP